MTEDEVEWEEPDERAETPIRRRDPLNEPRSRVRKFVYLVVALMPFVAFILLLPRGGEAPAEEAQPQPSLSPVGTTGTTGVQLAFPFVLSPGPPIESPDPAENIPLVAPGTTQCSDGVDNDRDGRVDLADPGCSGSRDNSESPNPVRRTPSPSPPALPPPAMPPPPSVEPTPEPSLSPPSPMPTFSPFPPSGPSCNIGDPGFPCNEGNQDDDDDGGGETPAGETGD